MAARPDCELTNAHKRPKVVQAAQIVAAGRVVKEGSTDSDCLHAAAGEMGCGVAWPSGGAAGDVVTVVSFGSTGVVPVIVGTGGATRGKHAVVVANGVADAPTLGGGTVLRNLVGQFTQSGVAGDTVGMRLNNAPSVST